MKRPIDILVLAAAAGKLALASPALASEQATETPPAGMVLVPAGRYTPLFRGEKDPKDMAVRAFFLDALPVTNGDFLEFVRKIQNGRGRK